VRDFHKRKKTPCLAQKSAEASKNAQKPPPAGDLQEVRSEIAPNPVMGL
jgi:hypothetical protein